MTQFDEHEAQEQPAQEEEQKQPTKEERREKVKKEVLEWVRTVCFVFAFVILVRTLLFVPAMVSGDSMYPTLKDRECMFVTRFVTYAAQPQRGDIIILSPPDVKLGFNQYYVKRIIGLPGETIMITGGTVFINGEPLEEPYIVSTWAGSMDPMTIPNNCYFVMGDNRGASTDSRAFGPLHKNLIGGKVEAVVTPIQNIRLMQHATYE